MLTMLVGPVGLAHVLVAEESSISNISGVDSSREEQEGKDTFPGLDLAIGNGCQDTIKPNVGENGPCGGDNEHAEMFDFTDFIVRDDVHAETNDHEQVEGSGADNGSGSKITSLE